MLYDSENPAILPAWYELKTESPSTLAIKVQREVFRDMREKLGKSVIKYDKECTIRFELPRLVGYAKGRQIQIESFRKRLHLVFSALYHPDVPWTPELDARPQLLLIEPFSICAEGVQCGAMTVWLYKALVDFLAREDINEKLRPVATAMACAYFHLQTTQDSTAFNVVCRPKCRLSLSIHESCCLTPEYGREDLSGGDYRLVGDNIDHGAEQVAFIWGLAKLDEVVRAG